MLLPTGSHIHFVAVCGTFMGTVATALREMGYLITGSDEAVYPPMSTFLSESGVEVLKGFDADNLDPAPDLVVIGNAMSRGNPEVEAALSRKIEYTSVPQILTEYFIAGKTSLVVTGTHGKTTTTSMLAWILECAALEPGYMIAGIPENFASGTHRGAGSFFVCEGDEYDTAFFDKRSKFVHYLPDGLIINNLEFDHGDIFSDLDDVMRSFRQVVVLVPENGIILANGDDANVTTVLDKAHAPIQTFGLSRGLNWRAQNITQHGFETTFDIIHDDKRLGLCTMPMPGEHNVRNALGAIALAFRYGVDVTISCDALSRFKGVKRRLQLVSTSGDRLLYDDFAHHPTAIAHTVKTLRTANQNSRLWAIFEPRSNTSVSNRFQSELTESLALADEVILGPIHRLDRIPAEERLDIEAVVAALNDGGVHAAHIVDVDQIADVLISQTAPEDVVVIMSNGGFGGLVSKVSEGWSLSGEEQ